MSEMPEEIFADGNGWHTSHPHMYNNSHMLTEYVRADLCNDKKQDKTVETSRADSWLLQHIHDSNKYNSRMKISPAMMSEDTKERYINWCEQRNEKPVLAVDEQTDSMEIEILKGVRDALTFYSEIAIYKSYNPITDEGSLNAHLYGQASKDRGSKAREQLTALNTLIEGK